MRVYARSFRSFGGKFLQLADILFQSSALVLSPSALAAWGPQADHNCAAAVADGSEEP